ncbi:MAG: energy transducer TonB family protein [Bdellovibrionota bacterium]
MEARRNREALILFIGFSLLVHFAFLLTMYYAKWEAPPVAPEAVYVDLNAVPPSPQALTPEQEKAKQVAESDVAPNTDAPKVAKYLGERNQTVDEETKAKTVDRFRKGGAPSVAGDGKKLSLKDLAPPTKALAPPTKLEMEGYKQEQQKLAQQAESGRGGSIAPDNAGSATNDYLKDVKDGDKTMLSTKEFVYFGYYRRIRERLEVAWSTRLRSTLDSYVYGGRQLANDRNYVTGVIVVLDRNGKVTGVQLLQGSGARDLDQAAIDAFQSAGPFPDPPSGIVDENGQIKIRWDFVLQS